MATSTQHFNLIKPSITDNVNVGNLNTNFENIDTIMYDNQQKSEGALGDLADAFSTAGTYAVGDLVIYENKLYKCTTAVTLAEAWDSTKWTATTLAAEMGKGLHIYSTDEQVVGTWIDGKPVYEKTYEYTILSTIVAGATQLFNEPNIRPISITGFFANNTDSRRFPLPYVYGSKTATLFFDENENFTLRVADDTWGTGYKLYIVCQYTKTTD